MIDPTLLRRLGWNDDLIAEVNRVAHEIDVAAQGIEENAGPRLTSTSLRLKQRSSGAPRSASI